MPLTKRDSARLERQLIASLTDACETAKAEIQGFEWLTHTVDYAAFPQSLRVTWVFDTRANKERALAAGAEQRLHALTAAALHSADVPPVSMARCVQFDSEEDCQLKHAGDWRVRLARR